MPKHKHCYFDGASVQMLHDKLLEYGPVGTIVSVLQEGTSFYLRVTNANEEGTDINESHVCPGSPGC